MFGETIMTATRILGFVGLIIPVIAALYGGITWINKLEATIANNTSTMIAMQAELRDAREDMGDIDGSLRDHLLNEVEKLELAVKSIESLYTQGREDMVKEMTGLVTQITAVDTALRALENSQYKLASEAELRAIEDSYYKLSDSIQQLKFDMKELERKLDGGY